jgi:hypothetical protein
MGATRITAAAFLVALAPAAPAAAAERGYLFKDVSVGATAFGGNEVVVFVERALEPAE